MLSEEDKQSRTSIEYWFKVVDLNGDGYITPEEMKFFYDEHISRMEFSPHESIPFSDILCQLMDMLRVEDRTHITLDHLKVKPSNATIFYNALLNLNKFLIYEQRDPFSIKSDQEKFANYSDWDLFALAEYQRLSDDGDEEENADLDDTGDNNND